MVSKGPSQELTVSWEGKYCRGSVIALISSHSSYTEICVLFMIIIKTKLRTGDINELHGYER